MVQQLIIGEHVCSKMTDDMSEIKEFSAPVQHPNKRCIVQSTFSLGQHFNRVQNPLSHNFQICLNLFKLTTSVTSHLYNCVQHHVCCNRLSHCDDYTNPQKMVMVVQGSVVDDRQPAGYGQ